MIRKILFLHINLLLPLVLGAAFYIPGFVLNKMEILRNHLPDMLWSYALVFALVLISGDMKKSFYLCLVSGFWGFLMEFLQLVDIAPGTFDVLDIFAEFAAAFLAAAIIRFWRIRNEEDKDYRFHFVSVYFCGSRNCQRK